MTECTKRGKNRKKYQGSHAKKGGKPYGKKDRERDG